MYIIAYLCYEQKQNIMETTKLLKLALKELRKNSVNCIIENDTKLDVNSMLEELENDCLTEEQKCFKYLESKGKYLGNVWTLNDVKDKYECSDEVAYDILNKSLNHPFVIETIRFNIEHNAEMMNLKIK